MALVKERPSAPPPPEPTPDVRSSGLLTIPWYEAAFGGLLIVGFLLRIHRLGERALHHDESLHALYSWYLFVGRGYTHDPMMHGPWQFHWTALIYFLFGDSDFTARLAPVLFGTALIGLPYLLRREIGRLGALVAAALLTVSPVFLYFSRFAREDIYFATWNLLIVVGLFGMLRTRKERYLYLTAVALAGGFATKEAIYISGFIWMSFFALMATVFRRTALGQEVLDTLRSYSLGAYARAVTVTVLFDGLLFTTFLTNMGDPWNCQLTFNKFLPRLSGRCTHGGLWTGTVEALTYWIDQHDVQRGGQPWFYYLLLLPLYEFLVLGLAFFALPWRELRGALSHLTRSASRGRQAQALADTSRNVFYCFCLWWAVFALLIYSYAGEKMPWITPHIALPMLLLGAMMLGRWFEWLNWRRLRQPLAWGVGGLGLLAIALTIAALGLSSVRAVTPLERQSFALERFSYLLALFAVVAGLVWIGRNRPGVPLRAPLLLAALLGTLVASIHTAWQLSYKNGDVPVELAIYVQSSPDVPLIVREIERIGFQTGQGKDLRILMDNGYTETVGGQQVVHEAVSWPFEWYLRDYRNRRYYSRTIGGDINLADYPVALIMGPNLDPVRDRLGDYNGQKYRLNWWYPEDYKGLSWSVLLDGLRDPANRSRLLQYILYREVPNQLGAREMFFFVRKEIPPLGPSPGSLRTGSAPAAQASGPRVSSLVQRPDGSAVFGRAPDGTSILSQPKGIAVGSDGRVYVVEAGAHRLSVFNADGSLAATWGRPGGGDNDMQEPWGVGLAPSGEIFVADTWNHRVLKFDPTGRLLKKWGSLGDTKGAVDPLPGQFWGPRDVKVGPDGLVYVTDTGNKRIQVFDQEGRFIRAFGGDGDEPGKLREPVGIAFESQTVLLVADAWNNRVQRLDLAGNPLGALPIAGWEAHTVTNKPYIALDKAGRIIAAQPDRGAVIALDSGGAASSLALDPATPGQTIGATGLAVGPTGELYVTDSRNGFVYRLPAPR